MKGIGLHTLCVETHTNDFTDNYCLVKNKNYYFSLNYCCLCKNVYFKFMSVVSYLKSVFYLFIFLLTGKCSASKFA